MFEGKNHVVVDSHFSGEATGRRALLLKDAPTFVQTEIPFDLEVIRMHPGAFTESLSYLSY